MTVAVRARVNVSTGGVPRGLYEQIGQFLADQRLAPEPANYIFAHSVLTQPGSALARAVESLTDGGIRLTLKDIEQLGADIATGPSPEPEAATARATLAARTQMQVEGFEDVVQGLHDETRDFGRDLAATVAAINRSRAENSAALGAIDEVIRITAAMAERVQAAEARLELATREAATLRSELEEARDNARRDPLTDMPNRRAFEEAYAARAAAGEPVWLAVCDIDHFKRVNDEFGHAVGDRVLKAIAASLTERCGGHFVARYGGEEFVVLFSGVDGDTAAATLDTVRDHIATKRYRLRESDASIGAVTLSAGLAPSHPDDSARTLFQRADALLYAAKRGGRNCIRVG